MDSPRCVVIGGGGHARVLIDCLRLSHAGIPSTILDAAREMWGTSIASLPVVGGDELLDEWNVDEIPSFVVGLGSIGDNQPRRRIFERAVAAGLRPLTVLHPQAVISAGAAISPGAQVMAGAIVSVDAIIGTNAIVNTGAIVEHDCNVGEHAHIASGACLAGGVQVEDLAHVGAGATVRQGVKIGAGSIVGAGAVVIRDVPAGVTVVGVPASPLKS